MKGFVLLSVMIGLVLMGASVLILANQSGSISSGAQAMSQQHELEHLLQAAETHAQWHLHEQSCSNFAGFSTSGTGGNSYAGSFSATAGSPIDISLSASLASGASASRTLSAEPAYQTGTITTVVSTKTSYIDEAKATDNFGDHADVHVGGKNGGRQRGLVQFNLSSIPAASEIVRATLKLDIKSLGDPNNTYQLHRLTHTWSEGVVAWEYAAILNGWDHGGEYVATPETTFQVSAVQVVDVDVTELVRRWHRGTYPNYGMIFLVENATSNSLMKFENEDGSGDVALEIEHKCECGQFCGAAATVQCDATFRPNTEGLSFAPAVGQDILGATAVPANVTLVGLNFGSEGGYLLSDGDRVQGYNVDGTALGECHVKIDVAGLSYSVNGSGQGQLIVLEAQTNPELHFFGEACSSGSTLAVSGSAMTNATGVAYLTLDESDPYYEHIAISNSAGAVDILDAGANWVATVTPDFTPADVQGLAHVYNQARLLLLDDGTDEVLRVAFDGTVEDRYDFSRFVASPKAVAVDAVSCAHLIPSDADDVLTKLLVQELSIPALAHWRLDEQAGTAVDDRLGNHPGTTSGAAAWHPADGAVQGALELSPISGGVVIPDDPALNLTESVSIAAWVRASGSGTQPILSRHDSPFEHNYALMLEDMQPRFVLFDGSDQSFVAPVTLADNDWYHLVARFNSEDGEVSIYVNGIQVLRAPFSGPLSATGTDLRLGASWSGFQTLNGRIDDVWLFAGVLSEDDIDLLAAEAPPGTAGTFTPPATSPALDCSSDTYADDFSNTGWFNWNGTSGSLSWSGGWTELDDDGSPLLGDVRKVNSTIDNSRSARVREGQSGLQRSVDLSVFTEAQLRFNYARIEMDSDDVMSVGIGNSSGVVLLAQIAGLGAGVTDAITSPKLLSEDIPSSHLTADAYIQIVNSSTLSSVEGAYIDNFVIEGCPP